MNCTRTVPQLTGACTSLCVFANEHVDIFDRNIQQPCTENNASLSRHPYHNSCTAFRLVVGSGSIAASRPEVTYYNQAHIAHSEQTPAVRGYPRLILHAGAGCSGSSDCCSDVAGTPAAVAGFAFINWIDPCTGCTVYQKSSIYDTDLAVTRTSALCDSKGDSTGVLPSYVTTGSKLGPHAAEVATGATPADSYWSLPLSAEHTQ